MPAQHQYNPLIDPGEVSALGGGWLEGECLPAVCSIADGEDRSLPRDVVLHEHARRCLPHSRFRSGPHLRGVALHLPSPTTQIFITEAALLYADGERVVKVVGPPVTYVTRRALHGHEAIDENVMKIIGGLHREWGV